MLRTSLALLLIAIAASGQSFEVASLKPSAPLGSGNAAGRVFGLQGGPGTPDPTRARFSNMGLKSLVSFAYDTSGLQISGPSWTDDDHFDIIATMPKGTTKEQFRTMLQNLLTERFKLEIHREQRTIPLFSLALAKGGAKLAKPQPDTAPDPSVEAAPHQGMQKGKDGYPQFPPGATIMGMMSDGGHTRAALQAHNQPVEWLVKMLSGQMAAPVVNDTGLSDKYDYAMTWIPEAPGSIPAENQDLGGPSLMNALQEQLGLKLIAKKGPVEFIVIDRAERTPAEN